MPSPNRSLPLLLLPQKAMLLLLALTNVRLHANHVPVGLRPCWAFRAFTGPTSSSKASSRSRDCLIRRHLHPSLLAAAPSTSFSSSSLFAASSTTSSSDEPLVTLEDGLHEDEQTIKKSRFIGLATNCATWDDATAFIDSVRADHPKARHVCFGFVAGQNPVQERASDDGEPTGTGGAPIIGAIKGEGLCDVVCCVVRYSGGIKLGAGGLIRAYGGTARLALRVGPNKVLIPKSSLRVLTTASNAGCVYQSVQKYGGTASGETYNDVGELEVTLVVETEFVKQLQEDIQDATKGGAIFQ